MAMRCLVTSQEFKPPLVQFAESLITSERQDGCIFVILQSNEELSYLHKFKTNCMHNMFHQFIDYEWLNYGMVIVPLFQDLNLNHSLGFINPYICLDEHCNMILARL